MAMFELIKLAWNLFVLHDSIDKGDMTAGTWGAALLFLAVVCAIGVPTILYYDRYPDAPPQLLFVAGGLLGLVLIIYFVLAIRWQLKLSRQRSVQK
jgi:hypothetical protein